MTTTISTPETATTYEVVPCAGTTGFNIRLGTGEYLRDKSDYIRWFATANSARKRISREKRGNYHK